MQCILRIWIKVDEVREIILLLFPRNLDINGLIPFHHVAWYNAMGLTCTVALSKCHFLGILLKWYGNINKLPLCMISKTGLSQFQAIIVESGRDRGGRVGQWAQSNANLTVCCEHWPNSNEKMPGYCEPSALVLAGASCFVMGDGIVDISPRAGLSFYPTAPLFVCILHGWLINLSLKWDRCSLLVCFWSISRISTRLC